MQVQEKKAKKRGLTLKAATAAELMSPNPVSLRGDATVTEAMSLLVDQGFSGAPVIDSAGRPIGVVSRTDLLIHDREKVEYAAPVPDYYAEQAEARARGNDMGRGFQVVQVDRTQMQDIMTPVVFAVSPDTPVKKVVEEMVNLKVHRLFVVDEAGVLVGVISAQDILRNLE